MQRVLVAAFLAAVVASLVSLACSQLVVTPYSASYAAYYGSPYYTASTPYVYTTPYVYSSPYVVSPYAYLYR